MDVRVIAISQSTGSGGEQVAWLVSEQLAFRHLDEEILVLAAEKAELDPREIAAVERRRPFVERLVEQVGEMTGLDRPLRLLGEGTRNSEVRRELIREAIRDSADDGDVVIVSHAASYALSGRPDLLRVFVTASEEARERRLADGDVLADRRIEKWVRDSDAARADYLRRFYGVERESPTDYDIVVSTDRLTFEAAAGLIMAAVRGL